MELTYQEINAIVKAFRYLTAEGKGNVEIETGLDMDELYMKLFDEFNKYAVQKKAPAFNEFEGT